MSNIKPFFKKEKPYVVRCGKSYLELDQEFRFDYEEAAELAEEYKEKLKKAFQGSTSEKERAEFYYLIQTTYVDHYLEH